MKKVLFILSIALFLTACANSDVEIVSPVEEGDGHAIVRVVDTSEYIVEKAIDIEKQKTIRQIMIQNFDIVEEEGALRGIDGHFSSTQENRLWVVRINGEMPTVPIKDYIVQDGDIIEWRLVNFNTEDVD